MFLKAEGNMAFATFADELTVLCSRSLNLDPICE